MKLKNFFDTHPVFHFEEFADHMKQLGVMRPASWRQQLSYHHKVGNLIHIRKFLYAVKPRTVNEENYWVDPYLIASKASPDAIIGYHSALELHALAYTSFDEFTYITRKLTIPFTYQNLRFRSVTFPTSLLDLSSKDQNVMEFERQGIMVKVTDLERTIVDILDRPNLAGGWEEIWRSLDHVIHFDAAKLVEYTLLLNNATTVAKVGFFLESRPEHLAVDQQFTEKLLRHIPKRPHYMNRDRKGKGKFFKKWRLIVPLEIIDRLWEEPHADDI